MMKKIIHVIAIALLLLSAKGYADFIRPISVTSLNPMKLGDVSWLIRDAQSPSYIAPYAHAGGGGTSAWADFTYNTLTFNFDNHYTLNTIYLWDYYSHSPENWKLKFFDNINGTGNLIDTIEFGFDVATIYGTMQLHQNHFSSVTNVASVVLSNTSSSRHGGVGLSEVHFDGTLSPTQVTAPSMLWLHGFGLLSLGLLGLKRKNSRFSGLFKKREQKLVLM